ncbi:MAG TPA: hypothetical protein VK826_19740 [Bacteroidia bacterium]|nr:hypothetical protein [Bacteroidia bacterium]
MLRLLLILSLFSTQLFATHPDAPLMDKYFQIVSYKPGKDSATKQPPRFYGIQFRGYLLKGYLEMNAHRHFHATYEIWKGSDSISFTNTLASDYYVTTRKPVDENFELEMVNVFPKMTHYRLKADSLFLWGDGEMVLVQYNQLHKRLQGTWISKKDSTVKIVIKDSTWTYVHEGKPVDPKDVYTFRAEDDVWMNGDWNTVCDHVDLTGPGGTQEFWVMGASGTLMMQEVQTKKNVSYEDEDIVNMRRLHAADREEIVKLCDKLIPILAAKEKTKSVSTLVPTRKTFVKYWLGNNDTCTDRSAEKKRLKRQHADLYGDTLPARIDTVRAMGIREGFDWKTAYAWNASTSFHVAGGNQVAGVLLSISDKDEESVLFEVYFQVIEIDNTWYLLPVMERYDISHYF